MANELPNKVGPWVVGDQFFDRVAEVDRLTQLLRERNSILLVAPRRIGKTSLVRETFRRMQEKDEDYPVFVDVQDCRSPEDVIVQIALATQEYRGLWSKTVGAFSSWMKQFRESVESIGSSTLLELKLREGIEGDWQAKGSKLVQELSNADKPIVICLDELPVMLNRLISGPGEPARNRGEADVFLSWLRKAILAEQNAICWIICGSIGLEPILARHNLSFAVANLRPFHLPAWSRGTADACIVSLAAFEGHEWSEASRSVFLDQLEHFIPHHVQMYFGHVTDDCKMRGSSTPTPEDVQHVWSTHMLSTRGHAELADYEERLIRVLDETAVDLALTLLTETAVLGRLTSQTAGRIARQNTGKDPMKDLRDVLRVLEHDGYLEKERTEDSWRFISPLIRDWWRHRFGAGYEPLDPEAASETKGLELK